MARGLVYDLLRNEDVTSVRVIDRDDAALARLAECFDNARVTFQQVDAQSDDVVPLFAEHDGAIGAAHYGLNLRMTQLAIEHGCNYVDLGGNNDVVSAQLALTEQARAAGVSVVPDGGLAPGMASLLVAWGVRHLPWADAAHIRVGGLPLHPAQPLSYERLFSVHGLINEYVEVPVALRDGQIVKLQPLGDIERVVLPDPVGELEAFNTSGGVSTLPHTFADRLRTIDYKTLRYPGHALAMRWMYELGLMSWDDIDVTTQDGSVQSVSPRALLSQQIERRVPLCDRDRTIVQVRFESADRTQSHELLVVDEFDEQSRLTAMMRTTAFPAAIIAWMQCSGQVQPGVTPQELAVDCDVFLDELERRGVAIAGRAVPAST